MKNNKIFNKKTILLLASAVVLTPISLSAVACFDNYKYIVRGEEFEYIELDMLEYDPKVFLSVHAKDIDNRFLNKNIKLKDDVLPKGKDLKYRFEIESKSNYSSVLQFEIIIIDHWENNIIPHKSFRIDFGFKTDKYTIDEDVILFQNKNENKNERSLTSLIQALSISVINEDKKVNFYNGTWFDYKINGNNYPTTWYFLSTAEIGYELSDNNQRKVYLSNINTNEFNNISNINSKDSKELIKIDVSNKKQSFEINNYKTIFIGNDFLKTKPYDLNNKIEKEVEEIANLSVVEVTFKNEDEARKATNNIFDKAKDEINSLKNSTNRYLWNNTYFLLNHHHNLINNDYFEFSSYDPLTQSPSSVDNQISTISGFEFDESKFDYNNPKQTLQKAITLKTSNYDLLIDKNYADTLMFIKQKYNNTINNNDVADLLVSFEDQYINLGNQKYKTQGLVASAQFANITSKNDGFVIRYDSNYSPWSSLSIGKYDDFSNLSLFLYTNKWWEKEKLPQYNLEKYTNYKFSHYDLIYYDPQHNYEQYPNQKKSYISELNRIYGNNVKTNRTNYFDFFVQEKNH